MDGVDGAGLYVAKFAPSLLTYPFLDGSGQLVEGRGHGTPSELETDEIIVARWPRAGLLIHVLEVFAAILDNLYPLDKVAPFNTRVLFNDRQHVHEGRDRVSRGAEIRLADPVGAVRHERLERLVRQGLVFTLHDPADIRKQNEHILGCQTGKADHGTRQIHETIAGESVFGQP